jgi:hypothetical protein
MIMTDQTGQANTLILADSLVEALLKELVDETSHPKTAKKTVTDVLTEELLTSLKEGERTPAQEASLETIIMAEALAPALAEALAPALAEALAPALAKALQTGGSSKQTAQETAPQEDSERGPE